MREQHHLKLGGRDGEGKPGNGEGRFCAAATDDVGALHLDHLPGRGLVHEMRLAERVPVVPGDAPVCPRVRTAHVNRDRPRRRLAVWSCEVDRFADGIRGRAVKCVGQLAQVVCGTVRDERRVLCDRPVLAVSREPLEDFLAAE